MPIPNVIYNGFPTILSVGLVLGLICLHRIYLPKLAPFKNSLYLAYIQLVVAASAAALSIGDHISGETYWISVVGLFAGAIVGIIDLVILIWWAAKKRDPSHQLSFVLIFILLRLFSHITLTFQFCWCLLLCTV